MSMQHDRGMWGSRLGFILATAGSAVGLGNIWGFPTQVGRGGGAVFVLVYLVCVAVICVPIVIAELTMGRHTRKAPVGAFRAMSPTKSSRWWLAGALAVMAPVGILSFYVVIGGWTLTYVWFAATGGMAPGADEAEALFEAFTANGVRASCAPCCSSS